MADLRCSGSFYQEARVTTLKAHLSELLRQGKHDELRHVFHEYLSSPAASRAGLMVSAIRDFNLHAVRVYSTWDREIALQLVQLAYALYDPRVLEDEEQCEGLLMDVQTHWSWLSRLEHVELFSPQLQCALCTLCPELLASMTLTPSLMGALEPARPIRAVLCIRQSDPSQKACALSQVDQEALACALVQSGEISLEDVVRCGNPLISETYLRHCLL